MEKKYKIHHLIWLAKDEASVRFHVAQDDYFGTMATIISLIRQRAEKNPVALGSDFFDTLNNLEKDLAWLQNNYQIMPRIKKKKIIPNGNEKNQ